MPDESLKVPLPELSNNYIEKTIDWWRGWAQNLTIPFEWQEQVIRAAITVKLENFEETGALVAALTTSIPTSPRGGNSDARYCWLRDTFWAVKALNVIGATSTLENYLKFISNVVAEFYEMNTRLQPVYGISLEKRMHEREMHRLPGYHGIGPVRLGNKDAVLMSNEVYGAVILGLVQMFIDKRLLLQGDEIMFHKMERLGEQSRQIYNKPDAGPRGGPLRVHTYSAVMCWAACDRLGKIACCLGLAERAQYWATTASAMKEDILEQSWNSELNTFVSVWEGQSVDAYLLLMPVLKFLEPKDPKFLATFATIEMRLLRKDKFLSVFEKDLVASTSATFEYIGVLALVGRERQARALFENMLQHLNHSGLLSETIDPETGEHWGNFPQTSALVGLIICASKLSASWSEQM